MSSTNVILIEQFSIKIGLRTFRCCLAVIWEISSLRKHCGWRKWMLPCDEDKFIHENLRFIVVERKLPFPATAQRHEYNYFGFFWKPRKRKNPHQNLQSWNKIESIHFFPSLPLFSSIQRFDTFYKARKIMKMEENRCCSRFALVFVIQDRQCRNDKMSLRNDEQKQQKIRRAERRKIIPYFDWCLPVNCVNFYIYLILFWKILLPSLCIRSKNRRIR